MIRGRRPPEMNAERSEAWGMADRLGLQIQRGEVKVRDGGVLSSLNAWFKRAVMTGVVIAATAASVGSADANEARRQAGGASQPAAASAQNRQQVQQPAQQQAQPTSAAYFAGQEQLGNWAQTVSPPRIEAPEAQGDPRGRWRGMWRDRPPAPAPSVFAANPTGNWAQQGGENSAVKQAVFRAFDPSVAPPTNAAELWPAMVAAAQAEGIHPQALLAVARVESGVRNVPTFDDPRTGRPASTAFGPWQILKGTWTGISRMRPQYNLSEDDRLVPQRQAFGAAALMGEVTKQMSAALGRPITTLEYYQAHMFGPRYGTALARLPDNAPMSAAGMPQAWLDSHNMTNWTAGRFREHFASPSKLGADAHIQIKIGEPAPSTIFVSSTLDDFQMEGWSPIRIMFIPGSPSATQTPAPAGATPTAIGQQPRQGGGGSTATPQRRASVEVEAEPQQTIAYGGRMQG